MARTLSAQRMHDQTPEPVYGTPSTSEQLLHRPVLAVGAVQGDERDVGRRLAHARDEMVADIDRHDLVAEALERVPDPRPDRSETLRSSERPPLRTATRLIGRRPTTIRRSRRGSCRTLSGVAGRSAGSGRQERRR